MTRPFRLLAVAAGANSPASDDHWPMPDPNDSDIVIVLAALLCALICVLGLIAVARCTWIRHLSGNGGSAPASTNRNTPVSTSNKGLKKQILRSLPKVTFIAESDSHLSDCAICLAEFVTGDEVRVLPQCGHVFHVACIDTWFGSHSSCPSCRKVLAVSRCQKCADLSAGLSTTSSAVEVRLKETQDNANGFLS